jgi:hypothetical protein
VPLDPEFVADCPYLPAAVLIDEIVTVDASTSTVIARLPTDENMPLTRDPERHPRHVSGGLMVHLTGILGFAHAYYVLELRHRDGWIGYGTHIHAARFRRMGKVGPPMMLACEALSVRRIRGAIVPRYRFRFTQHDELVYEAEHSAIFTRVGAAESAP